MPGPNESIKPVYFTGSPLPKCISFDEYHNTIQMSTVALNEISLADFKKIHAFFRKIEALKNGTLGDGNVKG